VSRSRRSSSKQQGELTLARKAELEVLCDAVLAGDPDARLKARRLLREGPPELERHMLSNALKVSPSPTDQSPAAATKPVKSQNGWNAVVKPRVITGVLKRVGNHWEINGEQFVAIDPANADSAAGHSVKWRVKNTVGGKRAELVDPPKPKKVIIPLSGSFEGG
jgi:hypothetical protein